MRKEKCPRVRVKGEVNPFVLNFILNVKTVTVSNKTNIGEAAKDGRFKYTNIIEYDREFDRFTKIYDSLDTIIDKLTPRTNILLLVVIRRLLGYNSDLIYLTHDMCKNVAGLGSPNGFHSSIKELMDNNIIAIAGAKSEYWINIMYLFKGDRIGFIEKMYGEKHIKYNKIKDEELSESDRDALSLISTLSDVN